MADKADDANEGSDEVSSYDYVADAAGDALVVDCADCGGTGNVCLLVTSRRCETCGGSGKVDVGEDLQRDPRHSSAKPVLRGCWVTQYTFDKHDELIDQRSEFVPDCVGSRRQ